MPKKISARKKLNRQEKRDLDIEIGFLEGLIRRDPGYVDALQLLGDDYTKRGNFSEGLKVDETLADLRPKDALVQYNLACSYSLTDRVEEAIQALEKAIDNGYCDLKWLGEDPDLEELRKHPLYQKVKSKLRRLKLKKV